MDPSFLYMFGFSKKRKPSLTIDPDEILADSVSVLSGENMDGKIERPIEKIFSWAFLFFMACGIVYLVSRAAFLQVTDGESFFQKSQENRFLMRPILPPRGIIYDHYGNALVENIPTFGLVFNKEAFLEEKGNLSNVRSQLEILFGYDTIFFLDAGFFEDGIITLMPPRMVVADDIPLTLLVKVASRLEDLPGIEIIENYRRSYRDPLAFSHLVGYIGKTSPDDLKLRDDLRPEDTVGRSGIEGFYDTLLRGKGGKKIVEIDSHGVETRFKFTEEPKAGTSVRLASDAEFQRVVYELLDRYVGGTKGASVIALDPRDGAVRALVSYPGFNSTQFSSSLPRKEFQRILQDPRKPLFNRAISGEFPSGSTIKPLIAAAALEEGIVDPNKKIYDEGFIEIQNPYRPGEVSVFKDWKKHGWVDFYDAIAVSANVYFYILGGGFQGVPGLGIEKIKTYAELFGLGQRLGIDLPGEKPGFIPDPETKKFFDPNDPVWRIGDTYNVSIGQGGVEVTPFQMASVVATIANGGTLYRPYVLEAVLDEQRNPIQKRESVVIHEHVVSGASLREVVRGMHQTVTAGVARLLQEVPVPVAAKTGTAQAGSGIPHAWVIAFAPVENPEIAVAVMVEHAGEGSTVAVPIMKEILAWYAIHRIHQE